MDTPHPVAGTAELPLDLLLPDPAQPRKHFDPAGLAELAASLKEHGQLQPARVRWEAALGRYVLLAGERRYRAAPLAGRTTLRCEVLDRELTPGERLAEQLAENLHRKDLAPMEAARGFKALMDLEGIGVREAARRLGLAPSTVSRALKLLDLPDGVRESVAVGNTSARAARRGKKKTKVPRGASVTLRTPRRWVLTVATTRKGITDEDVAAELEAVASQLRAKGGRPAGPRLSEDTTPPAEVA